MNKSLKLALTLMIIAGVVTGILAGANVLTKDKILVLNEEKETAGRMEVLQSAEEFEKEELPSDGDEIITAIYKGVSGGKTVGYVVNASPSGFGGAINMMVGLDSEGKVTGIKIISFAETPGLGTKTNEDKFKDQYKEQTPPISVIKAGTPKSGEIVAVSGATISSSAVTKGVNAAAEAVKAVSGKKGA